MFQHILLATDGSPACEHAVTLALRLAREQKARLTAVYVIDPYPYLGIGELNPAGFQAYMGDAHHRAGQALERVTTLGATEHPGQVDIRVVEDMAAPHGIIQAAVDPGADLVVVGSHGRSGVARLVLGSVAAKVVSGSPVPVLVARG